jgi:hypothetical protein
MLDRPTKHNSDFREASLSAFQVPLIMAMGEFIARGWPVIPLAGKSPLIPWKEFQARLPTSEEVTQWFSSTQVTGLGIVTGMFSGLVVVDCDSRQDAEFWSKEHGGSSLIVDTGGGGVHFYYAMPDGNEVGNRVRIMGRQIDIRGDGGYVAAPPSLHPSGTRYTWRTRQLDKALPAFDVAWLTVADQKEKIGNGVAAGSVRKVVAYISKIHAVAGEGGHNATFRAACKLRDAGLSKDEALAILSDWNETNATPPWSAAELLHKIHSAFERLRK